MTKIRRHPDLTAARNALVADLRRLADRLELAQSIKDIDAIILYTSDPLLSAPVAEMLTGYELHQSEAASAGR